MKHLAVGIAVAFVVICAWLWPRACIATQRPDCISTFVAAGQRWVKPAEVKGAPRDRLVLHGHHPDDHDGYSVNLPDGGYLLTGDKVDLVTTCQGYDYVRFHGTQRVSAGWVEASRIATTGAAYVPLPANAAKLCRAAEDTLNRDGKLSRMETTAVDPAVLNALHLDVGWNASTPEVAKMTVGGRSLAAVSIDSGGTCHSSTVTVLSGNLSSQLSPADRDDRDIENNGADSWRFGVSEDLVVVDGQPMVMSYDAGSTGFHLSSINKDGDIVPVCEGGPAALDKRLLESSGNDEVCHAILNGQQALVPLDPPTKDQAVSLGRRPDDFEVRRSNGAPSELEFHANSSASEVVYRLLRTGQADLGNTGRSGSVGVVAYSAGGSTAGCGDFSDSQVVPVYLDDHGRADPSSAINQPLAEALPHGMTDGRLATYAGKTYIELFPDEHGPSSEVWMVGSSGPEKVCSFQLSHFVVNPIAGTPPL